jgi:hypothetical protein
MIPILRVGSHSNLILRDGLKIVPAAVTKIELWQIPNHLKGSGLLCGDIL